MKRPVPVESASPLIDEKIRQLEDPAGLFNSSLEGNVRRAIDIHEGDRVDQAALQNLIRAAVALNLQTRSKPKPRRAGSKPAG